MISGALHLSIPNSKGIFLGEFMILHLGEFTVSPIIGVDWYDWKNGYLYFSNKKKQMKGIAY